MQENFELVQRGFRVLLTSLSGYIGQTMIKQYGDKWWDEILDNTLSDQRNLPEYGSYGDLVDSLDIANCIRIINRRWNDVYRNLLNQDCRSYINELMGVRNIVSHIGQQDLEQRMSERALDTMYLFCKEIDSAGAEEIQELYDQVRKKADDKSFVGLKQPESPSGRSSLTEDSLLNKINTDCVQLTKMTRKITYGGKTQVYPVYKVDLQKLYYNDQNDRIATWISQYEAENGKDSLQNLDKEIYNRLIENFVYDSNPESIQKTQRNIALVGQREPGVTLADGRVVDGNRRFTCLRRIQRETNNPIYFETVIMDMDIREDKKQIKLLELSIQHGEEKKIDYDMIDFAIGTYRDIIQTNLLTVEEYAESANESASDVKNRLEVAKIIVEFLEYLRVPEQYYIAREYQVYSLFQEMLPVLKQMKDEEKAQLKRIAFNNTLMRAITDQRKYIRDIKNLVRNDMYSEYFEEQKRIGDDIWKQFINADIRSKEDLDSFSQSHPEITEELQDSMEKALQKYRSKKIKNKPTENLSKCIDLLLDIDSRLFEKMNDDEKTVVKTELEELEKIITGFKQLL